MAFIMYYLTGKQGLKMMMDLVSVAIATAALHCKTAGKKIQSSTFTICNRKHIPRTFYLRNSWMMVVSLLSKSCLLSKVIISF